MDELTSYLYIKWLSSVPNGMGVAAFIFTIGAKKILNSEDYKRFTGENCELTTS